MAIQKFKSFEEAEQALWDYSPDREYYARLRAFFSTAERLYSAQAFPGIRKFRSIEEKQLYIDQLQQCLKD